MILTRRMIKSLEWEIRYTEKVELEKEGERDKDTDEGGEDPTWRQQVHVPVMPIVVSLRESHAPRRAACVLR